MTKPNVRSSFLKPWISMAGYASSSVRVLRSYSVVSLRLRVPVRVETEFFDELFLVVFF